MDKIDNKNNIDTLNNLELHQEVSKIEFACGLKRKSSFDIFNTVDSSDKKFSDEDDKKKKRIPRGYKTP